ncbi:calcium/sodium antiporter [Paraneptunicella aestuarii]|uniref:calcium/sodium antiporter n=1 Tax=Paraneptunicella aestuarii TaxID=2831148 RepID=UPI001E4A5699|nr:calcium/sodium antiporter [Paraneptunicella aestuarii]UAA38473.1 calcium/sodium antiporter [Paraneptunicella aestuarii]
MLVEIVVFILGLIALSWGADRFVYGASALAKNIGISPMVIGMTIVAMGSSAPEIMVAATASYSGSPDTAVGNAIGSNITNIMLVLALTAMLKPIMVRSGTIKRELPLLMIVSLIASLFLADYIFKFWEGAVLMVLFFFVIGGLTWLSIRADKRDPLGSEVDEELPVNVGTGLAITWVVVGLFILPISASYMVDSAVVIARHFGMSDLVIGLTIIAIGTSLPELAASIAGVLKNEDDLAMGNIIGSNIFNILAVLAMPALIAPGAIDPGAIDRDMYVMLGATMLLVAFSFNIGGNRSINRWQGGLLLAGFVAYLVVLLHSI